MLFPPDIIFGLIMHIVVHLIAILQLVLIAIFPFVRGECDTVFGGYDIHG
jgi:hypothetical protein